ncbi:hypothetical protein PISL3812_09047 [Talaromyces islandicus]|uniref:Transcription factor domain-containing protein n=1 Tax=Talaromyces islandicus TaxID=28573 RepID=A0A0U1M8N0_TALIS|nr:hypothetical protein PISL3812_09047 [Talaromyces islandicus]
MGLEDARSIAKGALAPVLHPLHKVSGPFGATIPSRLAYLHALDYRLLLKCDYPSPAQSSQLPNGKYGDSDGPLPSSNNLEACRQRALKRDLEILQHESLPNLAHINELFIRHKTHLVDLADAFLSSCQRWVHIVHAETFRQRCNAIEFGISHDYFALLLSMGMISRPLMKGSVPDKLRLTMYAAVKKLFWEMVPLAHPTLCLVQTGLLLSVYEYGQGMLNLSYITISACVGMAQILRLCAVQPPPYPQLGTLKSQDEGLQTWWGIMIHERMISLKSGISIKPLVIYSPDSTENELLEQELRSIIPQINIDSHYPCFYLQARAAIWLDRVLDMVRNPSTATPEGRVRLQHLDRGLLGFLRLLVQLGMGSCCEAIAIALKWRFDSNGPYISTKQDKLESSQALKTILTVLVDISMNGLSKNKDASDALDEWMLPEMFPYTIDTIYQLVLEMRARERLEYQTTVDPMRGAGNSSPAFDTEMKMLRYILEKQTMRWQISQDPSV